MPEAIARRERSDQIFFHRAVRSDERAVFSRCLEDAAVYWVEAPGAVPLPRGVAFVAARLRADSAGAPTPPGCRAVVIGWEAAMAGVGLL